MSAPAAWQYRGTIPPFNVCGNTGRHLFGFCKETDFIVQVDHFTCTMIGDHTLWLTNGAPAISRTALIGMNCGWNYQGIEKQDCDSEDE